MGEAGEELLAELDTVDPVVLADSIDGELGAASTHVGQPGLERDARWLGVDDERYGDGRDVPQPREVARLELQARGAVLKAELARLERRRWMGLEPDERVEIVGESRPLPACLSPGSRRLWGEPKP